jgi:hypothetical protein
MVIVDAKIPRDELSRMAHSKFGNMVKAVVDVARGVMAVDGELHADEEALLLEGGSRQQDLWGINLYPALGPGEWIEYDSLINLRPSQGNRSRGVDDPDVRRHLTQVVERLLER